MTKRERDDERADDRAQDAAQDRADARALKAHEKAVAVAPVRDLEAEAREALRQKIRDDLAARRRHVAQELAALKALDADLQRQESET
jgi:hypothetical protein